MPSIGQYLRLGPFSLAELVQSANALLRHRPRLQVQERTVRYYIAQKLLDPPQGPSRAAQYTFQHLVLLVLARCLQDQNLKLGEIATHIRTVRHLTQTELLEMTDRILMGEIAQLESSREERTRPPARSPETTARLVMESRRDASAQLPRDSLTREELLDAVNRLEGTLVRISAELSGEVFPALDTIKENLRDTY